MCLKIFCVTSSEKSSKGVELESKFIIQTYVEVGSVVKLFEAGVESEEKNPISIRSFRREEVDSGKNSEVIK